MLRCILAKLQAAARFGHESKAGCLLTAQFRALQVHVVVLLLRLRAWLSDRVH